jgi:hypothetical protein
VPRSQRAVCAKAIGSELGLAEVSCRAALARLDELETTVKTDEEDTEELRRVMCFEQIRKHVTEKTSRRPG